MSKVIALAPPPVAYHRDNSMWVDEQIWGHRLWDSQNPWLIFLEFMSVAEACHAEGRLLDHGDRPFSLQFRPSRRLYLRNILYNNEAMPEIAQRVADDGAAWREWLGWMQDNAQAVPDRDFSYLQKRFRSFHQFASLVAMIRSSTIESSWNKRWGSRFVFPFGRNAIYEDLNISGSSATREYINFGRTGEILYQMLVRSKHAAALRVYLGRAFDRQDPCDRLVELMQPDRSDDRQDRGGNSYLPYAKHPAFDAVAQDWLAVLALELPRFDAYPHLATLAAFHLARYQLNVASDICGEGKPSFVCEVVAPRKTLIRELSVMSYLSNNQLPQRALETYIREIGETVNWRAAAADHAGFATCRQLLRDRVRWPRDEDDYDGPADPDALLAALRRSALARHHQHVANVHRSYGGGAGLVSRRGTNRLRYAPTDELLKAIILANVPSRMEYGEFLSVIFDRYGLVVGEREARQVLSNEEFDKRAFQANSERLESRLRTLGMLRRLSDACAYVENPLRRAAAA